MTVPASLFPMDKTDVIAKCAATIKDIDKERSDRHEAMIAATNPDPWYRRLFGKPPLTREQIIKKLESEDKYDTLGSGWNRWNLVYAYCATQYRTAIKVKSAAEATPGNIIYLSADDYAEIK
jgi:hypothetical protein